MSKCLYLTNKNHCRILTKKECSKCSFYKDNTKENFKKYILEVEEDILLYKTQKNTEGS